MGTNNNDKDLYFQGKSGFQPFEKVETYERLNLKPKLHQRLLLPIIKLANKVLAFLIRKLK